MEYQILTQDERDLIVAEAIHSRELEHFHYDLNRQNYEVMLQDETILALPKEWPEDLIKHRTKTRDVVIAEIIDPDTRDLVLLLQQRDKLQHLKNCETVECVNVERIYKALVQQLPDERKKAAFDAAAVARLKE